MPELVGVCPRYLGFLWRLHTWGPFQRLYVVEKAPPQIVGLSHYQERTCTVCRLTERRHV